MERDDLEALVAAVIDAESAAGIRWGPGAEMATVAVRRWSSFQRRHKTKRPKDEDWVHDLAKGLAAHFEPETPFTPPSEWLHLAGRIAAVFGGRSRSSVSIVSTDKRHDEPDTSPD